MTIRDFVRHHYRHFNAAVVKDAVEAYQAHLQAGNKMLVSLAGAMSTAELGLSLAEMIRQDKVHMISCTGANLEEDIFNLVAHDFYKRVPDYRSLSAEDELALREQHLARVTDTCIPEEEAIRRIDRAILGLWQEGEAQGERLAPHQWFYKLIRSGKLEPHYQIDPKDSWLLAACEKDLPIYTPGWEDSTLGNIFASHLIRGELQNPHTVRSGIEQMTELVSRYTAMTADGTTLGFFQIGGGIAGDFPICVVPLILNDLEKQVPYWSYFCQISDSTTSYGSYSGAVPNEKITWDKLDADTPRFVIESDATIVAPLMFMYLLESDS